MLSSESATDSMPMSQPTPTGSSVPEVRTVDASDFRARCLKLMDEVAAGDLEVVITKNGHPVSRLVSCRASMFGIDRDRLRIVGDVVTPLGEDDWEAASDTGASEE